MEAVKQKGRALQDASEELKGNREVVMEAVKQDGSALGWASEELKGDRGCQAEWFCASACFRGAEGRQR
eukprot:5806854-Heterocapsa_arctica.AAC.1